MEKVNLRSGEFLNRLYVNVHITNLRDNQFNGCAFINCTFANADIERTEFYRCVVIDCDFETTGLDNSRFKCCTINNAKFYGDLKDITFTNCHLNVVEIDRVMNMNFIRNRMHKVTLEDVAANTRQKEYLEWYNIEMKNNIII